MIISIIFYICLFLYGIDILTKFLEQTYSSKMIFYLNKCSNIYISFMIGIIITFITQSSSAITAIVIAFLNSKRLELKSAIAITMGSNIGTTFTSLFTSINLDSYGVLVLIIGLVFYFIKKTHSFSYIFLGVGFIFFSLYCLKLELNESFKHLNYLKYFQLSNTSVILSTLNGILISGIIQSSSATISLAQIATQNNNISLLSGICIVLGANIGTTFTGLIASIRSSNNSKILAVSNLILNLLGVLMFLPFTKTLSKQIILNKSLYLSFIHILLNIISCTFGLIFINSITKLSSLFIKKEPNLN